MAATALGDYCVACVSSTFYSIDRRLGHAFGHPDPATGLARAKAIAAELGRDHPDAAASLRELEPVTAEDSQLDDVAVGLQESCQRAARRTVVLDDREMHRGSWWLGFLKVC